jgi:hypothetical protein
MSTSEPSDQQPYRHPLTRNSDIGQLPAISAMHFARHRAAPRTRHLLQRSTCLEDHESVKAVDTIHYNIS